MTDFLFIHFIHSFPLIGFFRSSGRNGNALQTHASNSRYSAAVPRSVRACLLPRASFASADTILSSRAIRFHDTPDEEHDAMVGFVRV